jgi:hypothetical protein
MTLILLSFFSLGSFTCSQLVKITCSRVRESDRDLCCKTLVREFSALIAEALTSFPSALLVSLVKLSASSSASSCIHSKSFSAPKFYLGAALN